MELKKHYTCQLHDGVSDSAFFLTWIHTDVVLPLESTKIMIVCFRNYVAHLSCLSTLHPSSLLTYRNEFIYDHHEGYCYIKIYHFSYVQFYIFP